jgi:hypothetical protein
MVQDLLILFYPQLHVETDMILRIGHQIAEKRWFNVAVFLTLTVAPWVVLVWLVSQRR